MVMDWRQFLSEMMGAFGRLAQAAPQTVAGYKALHAAGSGVLDDRTRELICIAVAVTTRCDGCIANHVEKARALGVSREEIADALGVAVAMNAGAAIAYSARALGGFDALGTGERAA